MRTPRRSAVRTAALPAPAGPGSGGKEQVGNPTRDELRHSPHRVTLLSHHGVLKQSLYEVSLRCSHWSGDGPVHRTCGAVPAAEGVAAVIMQAEQNDPTHRTTRECVLELEAHPYRIQQIRRIVAAQLRYWRLDPLIQSAASATSELLANVHRHARPDKKCGVTLTLADDRLTVAVTDKDPRLPQLRPVEPLATTGRGLTMVEALSDSWGTDLLPDETGKIVWFVLRTPIAVPTLVPVRTSVPFERAMAEPLPEPAAEPAAEPVTGTVPEPAAVPAAA